MTGPEAHALLLAAGQAALQSAAWAEARAAFERAVADTPTAEAHDGLGLALWWLNQIEESHQHRGLAFRLYKERGALGRAARIACWLGREQVFLHSNVAALQGWFSRAEQLIQSGGSEIDRAWTAIMRASMLATPQDMLMIAPPVIETARTHSDSPLEAFAMAFFGQALVTTGQVGVGMARLDEAMTIATGGEVSDLTIISEVFCVMLSTCEVAGDLVRSELWCRAATEFSQRYACPFLAAYCRTAYGGLMTALGRWGEAETALNEAIRAFEQGHRGLRVHAVIRLADLRAVQGKLEEAELLLDGMDDQQAAVIPRARLHLLRGEYDQARAVLEQALPPVQADYTLYQLPVLIMLLEVMMETDNLARAQVLLDAMTAMATQGHSPLLSAQIEFLHGRFRFQAGDFSGARARFTEVLARLRSYEQTLLSGQVRLNMAEVLLQSDAAGAVAWAKAALATFERIGAEREAARATGLLRQLGVTRGGGTRSTQPLTRREAEIVSLIALGMTNRDIAERLVISARTVEHHVGRILGKLNLRSRVEIAAYTASGKLSARDER